MSFNSLQEATVLLVWGGTDPRAQTTDYVICIIKQYLPGGASGLNVNVSPSLALVFNILIR